MNQFDFDLEDGDSVVVEYEPVDYDDFGNIEFDIYAYKDGKDIWHDISTIDRQAIKAEVKDDWKQVCKDSEIDAASNEYFSNNY